MAAGGTGEATGTPNATASLTTARSRAAVAGKERPTRLPRRDRGGPTLWFWLILAWQTFTRRDLRPLSWEMHDNYVAEGLHFLPEQGVFTLAVNHTMRRWTPRVLATIHQATLEKRPDLAAEWLVVVGYKEANLKGKPVWARWIVLRLRRIYTWIYKRWSYNALRLPMGNDRSSVQALREWKTRAFKQPAVVFPEGRGYATFREVRPGSGRWLATLGVPVLPVSIWWESAEKRWHIVFGPPVEWSVDARLHDLQIGLEIAFGLPPAEAPAWQEALAEWQSAHLETEATDLSPALVLK